MSELDFSIYNIKRIRLSLTKVQYHPIPLFWMSILYTLVSNSEVCKQTFITQSELMRIRVIVYNFKELKTNLTSFGLYIVNRALDPEFHESIRYLCNKPYYLVDPMLYIFPISNKFFHMFDDELLYCMGEKRTIDVKHESI